MDAVPQQSDERQELLEVMEQMMDEVLTDPPSMYQGMSEEEMLEDARGKIFIDRHSDFLTKDDWNTMLARKLAERDVMKMRGAYRLMCLSKLNSSEGFNLAARAIKELSGDAKAEIEKEVCDALGLVV